MCVLKSVVFALALLLAPASGIFAVFAQESAASELFDQRSDFTARVANGYSAPDGTTVQAGGVDYIAASGSRTIGDLPGWTPSFPAHPEHFGAVGDGRDDTAALVAALATGAVELTAGRTYGFMHLDVPPGTRVSGTGATLRYIGPDNRETVLTLGAGVAWDRLIYTAGTETLGGTTPSIRIEKDVRIGSLELEADRQLDALAVHVAGDGVDIGQMRSKRFGRPLKVEPDEGVINGFRLGWFDFESIARGIRMYNVTNFDVGGGRQRGRSPKSANERPGRNNLLLGGLTNGHFGPMDLGDAPEHAIRFAGGGVGHNYLSNNVRFDPLTIRRQSASALKINPGSGARVTNVTFTEVNIIDPFRQTGKNAKASHAIRISHADGIRIGKGSVRSEMRQGKDDVRGLIFAIGDSTDVEIGPFSVECCDLELVAFIENNDWDDVAPYKDIRNITFRGLSTTPRGAPEREPFRFRSCNITTGNVRFIDLDLRGGVDGPLFKLANCKAKLGPIEIDGKIDRLTPNAFKALPKNIPLEMNVTTRDGLTLGGSLGVVRKELRAGQ